MYRHFLVLAILASIVAPASAQFPGTVEGQLFVADRGTQTSGSDGGVRRYTHTGTLLQTLPTIGSGQVRGITVDPSGRVYVARGNQVRRYLAGTYTVDPNFIISGVKAQDVAYNGSTDTLWISWGSTATEAMLTEVAPATGNVIQTLTDASLVHPRSIAFDYSGTFLYIANGTGGNVIRLNLATTLPTFQTYATLSAGMVVFNAIGITVDANDNVFVVSDWGAAQTIVRITGNPPMTMTTLFLSYAAIAGMRAPAGAYADTYGNIYFACRNDNMSTDGIYGFTVSTMLPSIVPYVGMEHLSPIDMAFLPQPLTVTLTSPDGVDAVNVPLAMATSTQPTVMIRVTAPNFPLRAYGVLMSLYPPGSNCSMGQPLLPEPGQGMLLALGDPRRMPLSNDFLFLQSLVAASQGGTSPILIPPTVCPGSVPGTLTFFSGVTDMSGVGTAFFTLPTLPCLPVGSELQIGIAAAVTDAGQTLPLGIGAMSNISSCLKIRH